MKYHIITYGCTHNISDSERIASVLESIGFSGSTNIPEDADLLIYNTCAVKQKAEDKVLGLRKAWKSLREKNPKLVVAMTGCMVSHDQYKLASILPEVDIFFNIKELPSLPALLSRYFSIDEALFTATDYFSIQPKNFSKFQGLIPIMTGCDKFCSYCIVPYARGREVSRKPEQIISEAQKMSESGIKEILLLGENVDSYVSRDDNGDEIRFADLLYKINEEIPGLKRIRYMSPYPTDMTDRVIDAIAKLPTVCEHIHLPLQAGSNQVLEAMNRRYTKEEFVKLVEKIRKKIPGVAITTDIIVGFCGETEEDFQETLKTYEICEFDMAFISMYSERPGTLAAKSMKDDVSHEEKKRRWNILNSYVEKFALKNNKKYLGEKVEIIVEEIGKNDQIFGKTRTWKNVQTDNNGNSVGDLVLVEITDVTPWSMHGKLI